MFFNQLTWALPRSHWLCLHGLEYPGYEPYPDFDQIWNMVFICTQRNLVIHIPVYKINTSIFRLLHLILYFPPWPELLHHTCWETGILQTCRLEKVRIPIIFHHLLTERQNSDASSLQRWDALVAVAMSVFAVRHLAEAVPVQVAGTATGHSMPFSFKVLQVAKSGFWEVG